MELKSGKTLPERQVPRTFRGESGLNTDPAAGDNVPDHNMLFSPGTYEKYQEEQGMNMNEYEMDDALSASIHSSRAASPETNREPVVLFTPPRVRRSSTTTSPVNRDTLLVSPVSRFRFAPAPSVNVNHMNHRTSPVSRFRFAPAQSAHMMNTEPRYAPAFHSVPRSKFVPVQSVHSDAMLNPGSRYVPAASPVSRFVPVQSVHSDPMLSPVSRYVPAQTVHMDHRTNPMSRVVPASNSVSRPRFVPAHSVTTDHMTTPAPPTYSTARAAEWYNLGKRQHDYEQGPVLDRIRAPPMTVSLSPGRGPQMERTVYEYDENPQQATDEDAWYHHLASQITIGQRQVPITGQPLDERWNEAPIPHTSLSERWSEAVVDMVDADPIQLASSGTDVSAAQVTSRGDAAEATSVSFTKASCEHGDGLPQGVPGHSVRRSGSVGGRTRRKQIERI